MAIFVIRYYGGKNLGARRFEIISDLTQKAAELATKGDLQQSKLPLRQMIESAVPRTRCTKRQLKHSMRESHPPAGPPRGGQTGGNNNRFYSAAYIRETMLPQDTTDDDWVHHSSQLEWSDAVQHQDNEIVFKGACASNLCPKPPTAPFLLPTAMRLESKALDAASKQDCISHSDREARIASVQTM